MYQLLINDYDKNYMLKKIAPISHMKVTSDIHILLDATGFKMAAEMHERTIIPCTIESETRTRNPSPHLLHDKLSYVAKIPGYEHRHKLYMDQLSKYVDSTGNLIARTILEYLATNDILEDIFEVTSKMNRPVDTLMTVFFVYPHDSTIDLQWTDYYLKTLPINGICPITGKPDHIPNAYPANIRYPGDMAKLFIANPLSKMDSKYDVTPGYIASQKILHTLQVKCQGNQSEIDFEMSIEAKLKNYCIKD